MLAGMQSIASITLLLAVLLLLRTTAANQNNTNLTQSLNSTVVVCDDAYALAWSVSVTIVSFVFASVFCFEVSSDRFSGS